MYGRYTKSRLSGNTTRYQLAEPVSLFGRNSGLIPWLLQTQTLPSQNEPYPWHLDIEKALAKTDKYRDSTLVIDLKPKQHKTNVSLYELLDVWGYSYYGWTPILLHLEGLFVDEDPSTVNKDDFVRVDDEMKDPIYEFLYLDGSIENGKIKGTWNPPPVSPTNAVLLWPYALKYFIKCIIERTPDVLDM